jgi:uncharacterized spore protein YtfJ
MSTPVPMSAPAPVQPIAELFERNLTIRHVYAEPVHHGEVMVIPVAKVAFGFGAGVGRRARPRRRGQASASDETSETNDRANPDSMGGGGGARLTPFGALEVGPQGTRFIHFSQLPQMLGVLALGVSTGLMFAGRRRSTGRLRPGVRKMLKRLRF